jgi:hypothetical protein
MTMKLIGCNTIDFNGHAVCRARARNCGNARAEGPIHVHVRVRDCAATPEVRQAGSAGPHSGRLPVGSMLDCYM